ncbi:hypothetical protein [Corynebacterium sp. SA-MJD20WY100]|uniref:hypothetical protein n=1 Tax=Corynebacterium sp. SA-MJD20WY100 TaxID=3142969 RepID=UPI0032218674
MWEHAELQQLKNCAAGKTGEFDFFPERLPWLVCAEEVLNGESAQNEAEQQDTGRPQTDDPKTESPEGKDDAPKQDTPDAGDKGDQALDAGAIAVAVPGLIPGLPTLQSLLKF